MCKENGVSQENGVSLTAKLTFHREVSRAASVACLVGNRGVVCLLSSCQQTVFGFLERLSSFHSSSRFLTCLLSKSALCAMSALHWPENKQLNSVQHVQGSWVHSDIC